MTLKDIFQKLKKDRVQLTGINAIRVPATAHKATFFITEVRSSNMVKVEVEFGTKSDGSLVPFGTLGESAKNLVISKMQGLLK